MCLVCVRVCGVFGVCGECVMVEVDSMACVELAEYVTAGDVFVLLVLRSVGTGST